MWWMMMVVAFGSDSFNLRVPLTSSGRLPAQDVVRLELAKSATQRATNQTPTCAGEGTPEFNRLNDQVGSVGGRSVPARRGIEAGQPTLNNGWATFPSSYTEVPGGDGHTVACLAGSGARTCKIRFEYFSPNKLGTAGGQGVETFSMSYTDDSCMDR